MKLYFLSLIGLAGLAFTLPRPSPIEEPFHPPDNSRYPIDYGWAAFTNEVQAENESVADTNTYPFSPDLSPHFLTNTPIIWQVPPNVLPESFWFYRRLPPRPFSTTIISNAVILAHVQDHGFPKPSTNNYNILSDANCCGMRFPIFSIQPAASAISFSTTNRSQTTNDMPDDATIVKRASEYAISFGLDPAQLIQKPIIAECNSSDDDGHTLTNSIYARRIFLSRNIDGISFFNGADNGDGEGISVELGSHGQTRSVDFRWPNLARDKNMPTPPPDVLIGFIRQHKVMVWPIPDEPDFFARIKYLATAKTCLITNATPYYFEGVFGEMPTNDAPSKIISPFVVLDAVADFGTNNVTFQIIASLYK